MIEWFAKNHVAANLMMIAIMLLGLFALRDDIALELMPDFSLRTITITTVLPGGNPNSIAETVTSRIEEAIADLVGLKKVSSRSAEDISVVFAQIESGYDEENLLSDVKVRVDALNTLPADAERPLISLADVVIQVLGVVVYGDVPYDDLYQATADLRKALLQVDGVTQVSELQAPPREIHVEVDPKTLRQYNLTLADVGAAIQRNSVDISAGNLRTRDGDILIRTNAQAYSAAEFEEIPIINSGDRVVYLRDIARVIDGYVLRQVESEYNGAPAVSLEIYRIGNQSTLEVADKVLDFIDQYQAKLPYGLRIGTYGNTAAVVEDRLTTLISSALQGGVLVLILLSLFLRPAVAFWVGLGIPVCFLGAFAMMPYLGLSLNMLTMFAFILVLGIVVDDAIVTGENIYRHQRLGMPPAEAALFGTKEVAVPVTFGVVTTMVAFAPLLLVTGDVADLAKQIPLVVIPVLAFSLIESKLILPSHMSTIKPRDETKITGFGRAQQLFSRGFENAIIRIYKPFLNICIRNKAITLVAALAIFVITVTSMYHGWLRSSFFPEFEDNAVFITLTMPATTGYETTKGHVENIVDIAGGLADEYVDSETGESYFKYFISVSGLTVSPSGLEFGTNRGMVIMEFVSGPNGLPPGFSIRKVQDQLRTRIGDIPGVEKLSIQATFGDFGRPISVAMYGDNIERIEALVGQVRQQLKTYPGVFDIQDNLSSGKEELQLTLRPLAKSLGLTQANIASQVRDAVFGHEAQRIQREGDEIKVMVRYPLQDRSSISDVSDIQIATPRSTNTIPLSELADIAYAKSPSAVYHDRQRRAVTVSADLNTSVGDADIIRQDLRRFLTDLFAAESDVTFNMDGQAETQKETVTSFLIGFVLVIVVIYALLAIPFKSFGQPLVVMSIIPLAIVGAIAGHYIMDLAFSMLSIMGILGLTGIVVNDSLVLVDYINQQRAKGVAVVEAVLTAGETRFRPVMLTSLTTFAGLLPLMLNKSTQAQSLVPMAVSLGFGILFATLITLVITPVMYLVGRAFKHASRAGFAALWRHIVAYWNKSDQPAAS